MKKLSVLFFAVGITALAAACESRFVESSPSKVDLKGATLEQRIAEKTKLDERVSEIERAADKANAIIDMFKRIQNPDSSYDVYTPIDFLLDVSEDLKKQLPVSENETLVRHGRIQLPFIDLSEECRIIETLLMSSKITGGERVTYSLKTCKSNDAFVPALDADWINNQLSLNFHKEAFASFFKDVMLEQINKSPSCKVTEGKSNIVDAIECRDMVVPLSASELAYIDILQFSNSGEIRLLGSAAIYENFKLKARSKLEVSKNGAVKFNVTKTADEPEATQSTTDESTAGSTNEESGDQPAAQSPNSSDDRTTSSNSDDRE